ncbi:hypothetical protein JCM3774_006366 [Rhodotorula dairenensis]
MNAADPTNLNAVAGPSRLAYGGGFVASSSTAARNPPPPTATASQPPGQGTAANMADRTGTQSTARKEPVRRAGGPVIVPTRVEPDNVRVVPQQFENCQLDDLISLIASMLDRLIEHNDRIPLTSHSLTRFHSRAPPNITVRDYLLRIAKYTNVEPCCLLILLPYVDKACARITSFTISSLTVHRFIIAAISVGSKALSDAFCTNGRYARVGGISVVEMNLLEKEFCEALDWRLTTSGPVLAHYYTSLVRSHPSYRLSTAPAPSPPPPAAVKIPAPLPASLSTSTSPSPSVRKQQPPPEPQPNAMDVDPSHRARSRASDDPATDLSSSGGSRSSGADLLSFSSSSYGGASTSSAAHTDPDPGSVSGPRTISTPSGEPVLFPPDMSRHVAGTGSNLPSPARGAEHTPPPIEGQGSGAGARGASAIPQAARNGLPSGLRYLESATATGAGVLRPGDGVVHPYGVKRAHDRLTEGSRSRSRDRGDIGAGRGGGGSQGSINGGAERVGSPLAAHAAVAANMRLEEQARLGKSPRLAYER